MIARHKLSSGNKNLSEDYCLSSGPHTNAIPAPNHFKYPYIKDNDTKDESDVPGKPDSSYVLSANESFLR